MSKQLYTKLEEVPSFQRSVYEAIHGVKSSIKGFKLGIELEHEGEFPSRNAAGWTSSHDGSLGGNGREFVSRVFGRKELDKLVDTWYNEIAEHSNISEATNTSTHVHVNVSDLPVYKLYPVLAAYMMVEPLLFTLCREDRMGNNFCAPVFNNAPFLSKVTRNLFQQRVPLTINNERYSSLNLASLSKFGTLEFRQMHALSDPYEIKNWVTCLYNLVQNSSKRTVDDMYKQVIEDSFPNFVESLFGPVSTKYIIEEGLGGDVGALKSLLMPQIGTFPAFLKRYPPKAPKVVRKHTPEERPENPRDFYRLPQGQEGPLPGEVSIESRIIARSGGAHEDRMGLSEGSTIHAGFLRTDI